MINRLGNIIINSNVRFKLASRSEKVGYSIIECLDTVLPLFIEVSDEFLNERFYSLHTCDKHSFVELGMPGLIRRW